jgi:quercetin dioxygenase-like cupin family protein
VVEEGQLTWFVEEGQLTWVVEEGQPQEVRREL